MRLNNQGITNDTTEPGSLRGRRHADEGQRRRSLAVEPMTCPPDAFRSGVDLVVLQPGESHRASFTVAGDGPA